MIYHRFAKKLIGLTMILVAACVPEEQAGRVDVLHGKSLFDARCAQCHGADAQGAGPASLGLGAPPPSLRALSAMNGGTFPRAFVMSTIDGLSRHNQLISAMPEFGTGDLGPVIQVEEGGLSTPVPSDLIALANYLESIQEPVSQ